MSAVLTRVAVLVINKLATIAGRTKRVSEILELVDELESTPREPFNARELESTDKVNPYLDGIDAVRHAHPICTKQLR